MRQLEAVLKQLHTELDKTEKDLAAFAAKHRLRTQDDDEAPAAAPAAAEKKGSVGVLV